VSVRGVSPRERCLTKKNQGMKLSVIIVNYKVKYYLEQCLLSLFKATGEIKTEVLVVDNHSADGSLEYLRKRFRNVKFIGSSHNLGFARANNLAIRRSKGEYVLLLNPDTVVAENTIRGTIDFMDAHPEAGSCGVRMSRADGRDAPESRRGLPTPLTSFYKMSGLCARYPNHPRFGRYYMAGIPWDTPQEIEVVSGAYCMLRRKALDKVGLLDEDFFMYGEDIDLSYRILKGGYKNYYLPFRMLHYKGESTQESSFRYVHVFYDSIRIFFRKHYSHYGFWISLPINIAIYGKAVVALFQLQARSIRKALGFLNDDRDTVSAYVFIGRNLDGCRSIADDNALDAHFIEGDSETMPDGHLEIGLPDAKRVFVTYDTDSFSYGQIIDIFARKPIKDVYIGMYNPRANIVVTPSDIFYEDSHA